VRVVAHTLAASAFMPFILAMPPMYDHNSGCILAGIKGSLFLVEKT
jgi:hypothetical protein